MVNMAGVYEENITLLPFISIRGYGKKVTILKPSNDSNNHINMTTDSCLFDLSINFINENDIDSKTLIHINTNMGTETVPLNQRNFNKLVLIKDVDIDVSGINNFTCIKLESGVLNLEDSFLKLSHDFNESFSHTIHIFDIDEGNKMNIIEGKFDITTNSEVFFFCKAVKSNVSLINSFIDIYENIRQQLPPYSLNNNNAILLTQI